MSEIHKNIRYGAMHNLIDTVIYTPKLVVFMSIWAFETNSPVPYMKYIAIKRLRKNHV